ncbi:NAD-dependent deacetylase hst3 [Rhodotorula kratochvilovae]
MQTLTLEQSGEPRATTKALDALAHAVARSKRTVLLVGAGISTNAGIPDFRSQGSGLYSTPPPSSSRAPSTSVTPPPTLKGPALFSASVYSSPETTSEHLRFIAAFKRSLDSITSASSSASTSSAALQPVTATHDFMRLLKKRGKLLRVYTQNIDGLEGVGTGLVPVPLEGITPPSPSSLPSAKGKGKAKLEGDFVQLHGAVHAVRCTGCDFVRAWSDEDGEAFAEGCVGACPQCEERASLRLARGQRTLSSLSRAFLRPSITLYNESPPSSSALTIGSLSLADLSGAPGPDVMLVMGTSLRIPGFKKLVKEFARSVKSRGGVRVLVNREEIGSKSEWRDVFDYQVIADTNSFVTRLVADWKRLRPHDWTGKQATLGFTATKGVAATTAGKPPAPRRPLSSLSVNTPTGRAPPGDESKKKRLPSSPPPSTPAKRARPTPSDDERTPARHTPAAAARASSPSPSAPSAPTTPSSARTTRNSLLLRRLPSSPSASRKAAAVGRAFVPPRVRGVSPEGEEMWVRRGRGRSGSEEL